MQPNSGPLIYDDPLSVDRRLERLSLVKDDIERPVFVSEYHRDQRTNNDAPGAPGWIAYTWCVRVLREILIVRGWERSNDQNRATVVSPDGNTSIAVVVGDEGTGKRDMIPDVQTPKGEATKRAVSANQPPLFDYKPFPVRNVFGSDGKQTWFLLRRRTEDAVYIELSLPESIVDGQVNGWIERIILGRYPYETQFNMIAEDDSEADSFDIPVARRQ
jgi:hypothetical protein